LPVEIGRLTQLSILNLSYNKLTTLPIELALKERGYADKKIAEWLEYVE
jgi:Leucine-rich repeat (LRR) protein